MHQEMDDNNDDIICLNDAVNNTDRVDDNNDDDDDEEEELITAQKVLENIENAWINEKFAPDILPPQTDMLELMLGQIKHMEDNMKLLLNNDKNDFKLIVHNMEIERIRYIIVNYLRCRLNKIELYTKYILNEELKHNINNKRLSIDEFKYAKEYLDIIENFFNKCVLNHIPNIQKVTDNHDQNMIIRPNLMNHVFIKANEQISSVIVGIDDEEVDLDKNSQHIIPYQLISDLVLNGKISQKLFLPRFHVTQLIKRMKTTTANDTVIAQEFNDKGVITLNRPKALNAINLNMVQNITNNLKKWQNTKNLVIIKGVGEKSFCAGGDVRAVVEAGPTEESKEFFRREYQMNSLIGNYKIPYIAFIDGITMGGGVGLSVHGKYRIATERTVFAMPETAIGLFPDVGGSYFLPKLQGKLGLFLGLTGYRLKGEDVLNVGIATHYCESSKLQELENKLLQTSNNSEISKILDEFKCPATNNESEIIKNLNKINQVFNGSTVEEIFKNLENDNSEWSQQIVKTLKKMSPTSLKVTFEEYKCGANQSLNDCLKMEYRLVVRHLENSDFKEGVRALLIDKDQKPKWNPSRLEEVTEERVKSFFAPLPDNEELKLEQTEQMGKSKL